MSAALQQHWIPDAIAYDGSQLRSHWILERCELVGDAIVGFRGGCAVRREEIADLADLDGPGIAGDDMVHLLWEAFTAPDLLLAVHRQRLLAAQAHALVCELAPASTAGLRRDGDDLWLDQRKLSISIATVTPVSALIHFAVNVAATGAPVPIVGLAELGIAPETFGRALLERVAAEQASIAAARAVVRPKGEWR
ncbi:MAG: DUF366 family protein [Planctomycetes bacterium]|nr:DUF366 family protein [Planctomycetota bacterium]